MKNNNFRCPTRSGVRREPSLQVGDKVHMLGWKHLFHKGDRSRTKYGFIVRIDGAYIQVRPQGWKKDTFGFELYPSELSHVRRYPSRHFAVGQKVAFNAPESLDWGKGKPRASGIVKGFKGPYVIVDVPRKGQTTLQFELFAGQIR